MQMNCFVSVSICFVEVFIVEGSGYSIATMGTKEHEEGMLIYRLFPRALQEKGRIALGNLFFTSFSGQVRNIRAKAPDCMLAFFPDCW